MDRSSKNGQSYVFFLKEGPKIADQSMDYSLLMLNTSCLEKMSSPAPANAVKRMQTHVFLSLKEELCSQNAPQS